MIDYTRWAQTIRDVLSNARLNERVSGITASQRIELAHDATRQFDRIEDCIGQRLISFGVAAEVAEQSAFLFVRGCIEHYNRQPT